MKKAIKPALFFLLSCYALFRFARSSSGVERILLKSISSPETLSFYCSPSIIVLLLVYLVGRTVRRARGLYENWTYAGAGNAVLDAASVALFIVIGAGVRVEVPSCFLAEFSNGVVILQYSYRHLLIPLTWVFALFNALRLMQVKPDKS